MDSQFSYHQILIENNSILDLHTNLKKMANLAFLSKTLTYNLVFLVIMGGRLIIFGDQSSERLKHDQLKILHYLLTY